MKAPQLIIFDCDGVLVDSESLSCRVIAEEITALGYPMTTDEAIHEFAGGSMQRVRDFILRQTGKPSPPHLEETYRQRTYALFRDELQPIAGIDNALRQINTQSCVASNGPLEKIVQNLQTTRLAHHFAPNHLFSAYQIRKWKPDPSLYLHAAKTMGIAPEACVVVEDSVHGVKAAVAAGMRVFGYTGTKPATTLAQAGAVTFSEMQALPDLLTFGPA